MSARILVATRVPYEYVVISTYRYIVLVQLDYQVTTGVGLCCLALQINIIEVNQSWSGTTSQMSLKSL